MDCFFKEKEIEIKELLEKEFAGKECRLEHSGNGNFVAHVTDMYFFGGGWRCLYVNRMFHIKKEVGFLTTGIDSHVNESVVSDSIKTIHRQLDDLLQELGYK